VQAQQAEIVKLILFYNGFWLTGGSFNAGSS
jgi:hypothetical protein